MYNLILAQGTGLVQGYKHYHRNVTAQVTHHHIDRYTSGRLGSGVGMVA